MLICLAYFIMNIPSCSLWDLCAITTENTLSTILPSSHFLDIVNDVHLQQMLAVESHWLSCRHLDLIIYSGICALFQRDREKALSAILPLLFILQVKCREKETEHALSVCGSIWFKAFEHYVWQLYAFVCRGVCYPTWWWSEQHVRKLPWISLLQLAFAFLNCLSLRCTSFTMTIWRPSTRTDAHYCSQTQTLSVVKSRRWIFTKTCPSPWSSWTPAILIRITLCTQHTIIAYLARWRARPVPLHRSSL